MEENKINGIPNTAAIILESNIDQWKLFSRGVTSKFHTSGIIMVDKITECKVRISIVMELIVTPQQYLPTTQIRVESSEGIDQSKSAGLARIDQFIIDEIDNSTWILAGYIAGKINTPLVIQYCEKFDYAVYSVIKEAEEITKYFPQGIPNVNPQSN